MAMRLAIDDGEGCFSFVWEVLWLSWDPRSLLSL